MYQNHSVSLVIPCYNEALGLRRVLPFAPAWIDEVVVVDNNSQDGTRQVALQYQARVVTEPRRGYGAALKRGLTAAAGDIVAFLDGDGQHNPRHLEALLSVMFDRQADCVSASRFPLAVESQMSKLRWLGNWAQTELFNLLFGQSIADSQSGMMACRRERVTARLPLDQMADGMAFSEEFKARVIHAGLSFQEVPIVIKKRCAGQGKLADFSDGVRNMWRLLQLFYEFKRPKK